MIGCNLPLRNRVCATGLGNQSPSVAYHDGIVAVFDVYMDESGTHDEAPVIVVAAYIGRSETWCDWTSKWITTIHPIKVYHAARKLLPIASVVVSMDLRVFEAAMKGRDDLREMFGTPYVACSQSGVDLKPPQAAVATSHGGERCGKVGT